LFEAGRLDEGVLHLRKVIRINQAYYDARKNLGMVFLKLGKVDEAIACFNETLQQKEDFPEAYYGLAMASGIQKRYDDAIKYLTTVLKLDPKYPDAHYKMGVALMEIRKTDEAIAQLNKALRTSTDQAAVYVKLGVAYHRQGKYGAAIQNWTKAVELKPDNVNILSNLAWLLATASDTSVQDANKAIGFAKRACELTGYKKAVPLDALAAAYAAAGRFDEAVTTASQAVDAIKATDKEWNVSEIQERIKLYKARQPYRQK
jgi:tetratricopeptide (TPR) repeat protein